MTWGGTGQIRGILKKFSTLRCRKRTQSKALTYRVIMHDENILIKAFIQSFTPKNCPQKILYIEETEL